MQNEKLYDKRTVNRNVTKKLIGQKDVESHKKALDDDAAKLEVIKLDDDVDDEMPTTEDYKD